MKNIFFHLLALLCLNLYSFSQSPNSFSYQAVVRDNLGEIIPNQNVSFRLSIQQSAAFTDVYVETQTAVTNNFGLVNLQIGTGNVISGDFSTIEWGSDISYIQVEIDPTGGTAYQIMGVSQLLSVPYALYSESSADSSLWELNGNTVYYDAGNVGIGSITPNGRLLVQSDASAGINDDIFSVLNANGDTVFAVYQEGVRIWVDDNGGTKANGSRGGFAVGGFSPTKAGVTNEYLVVTPDSVRVYIDDSFTVQANGSRGGFAVGGFNPTKGTATDNYLFVQDDSTRIYTGDQVKGFGVRNINGALKQSYMQLNPNNYFIGHESGDNNINGLYNSFIGYNAGKNNQSGNDNIFIGYTSGITNIAGSSNVSLGNAALYTNNGNDNIAIGTNALYSNGIGGFNIAIGTEALYSNINSSNNLAIGYQAMRLNTTGWENTALGKYAMMYNSTGTSNIAIGQQALYRNTTGGTNVAIGNTSLYYNNGSNNTALGAGAYFSISATSYTNSTALGAGALINTSNKVRIGNSSVTVIEGQVAYTFPSDGRFKYNVKEEVKGLEFITKLRPIIYQFDTEKFDEFLLKNMPDSIRAKRNIDYKESSSITHTGFIAQEVEQAAKECGFIFDGVNVPKNEDENYGVAYSQFTVPLVKAVQEQQEMIEELKLENEKLKVKNEKLNETNSEIIDRLKKLETSISMLENK